MRCASNQGRENIESKDAKNGQLLNAKFNYHHKPKNTISENNLQFKISSRIVKQIIDFGLENGWKPMEQIAVLNLGHVDNEVELFVK